MEFLIQPMEMGDEMVNALINMGCYVNKYCNDYVAGCGCPPTPVKT